MWKDYWFKYLGKMSALGWLIERLTAKAAPHGNCYVICVKVKDDLKTLSLSEDKIKVVPNGGRFPPDTGDQRQR